MRVIKKRNEMKWKKTRWWHWPGSLIQSAHTNLLLYNNNASERGPCRAAQQMSNGQRQRGFGLLHKSVRELQTSRKRIKSCSLILVFIFLKHLCLYRPYTHSYPARWAPYKNAVFRPFRSKNWKFNDSISLHHSFKPWWSNLWWK